MIPLERADGVVSREDQEGPDAGSQGIDASTSRLGRLKECAPSPPIPSRSSQSSYRRPS